MIEFDILLLTRRKSRSSTRTSTNKRLFTNTDVKHKTTKTKEPIELESCVVIANAHQFEEHEFPMLRNEFTKCENLWNFLDFQEEHIPYIKSRLDFVESITFLSKYDRSSLYESMFIAFKTRIKYYNERFVAKFAKHTGTVT